jgi:spore coat protein JB
MISEQKKLMKRLQICDFTLDEMGLYLDTHPDDICGLEYFKKYQLLKQQALLDYISKFGPIDSENYVYEDRYTWVDNPWPWELEGNR